MGNKRRWALAGLAVCLAIGLRFFWEPFTLPGCRSEVLREEVSPDGNLRAVLSVKECMLAGAVFELALGSRWSSTMVFSHRDRFDFCWKSSAELVVQSLPAPYLMEEEAKGVKIVYGGMQECPVASLGTGQ